LAKMTSRTIIRRARIGTALVALAASLGSLTAAAPAAGQAARTYKPSGQVLLSVGEGQMLSLPRAVADVWVSNPGVADVDVTNTRQMKLFGKEAGEATVIATASDGSVVYATNVRVSQNITSVGEVLRAAMPQSDIRVMNVGQMAILSGTVASPNDSAQAEHLVEMMLNPGIDLSKGGMCKICVVNRLSTATPLQVNLRVRIAEVNRSVLKDVGVNLLSHDGTSGFQFGVAQGEGIDVKTGDVLRGLIGTTLQARGKLFGLDLIGRLNLAESDGLVTTLAEPNLTALSGETASFLAGGEFPVPVPQGNSAVTIEYKQYGVGLAFTPYVLGDGRISMRVRPEVSELSNQGSVKLGDFIVPALTTRRAETTVELGSGQSFMIAGLLRNSDTNDINKAPFLGDLPILGTLFRSTSYKRQQTELVIIVTPYLVRPVSQQLALPTDGYRAPSDPQRIFEGQTFTGVSGAPVAAPAPAPAIGTSVAAAPGFKL
ncbi:MAG: type II and III secretion system protein family protein, partial [Sphingomicrobium sp.]